MTYANFKTMVLSYVNRSSAIFTSGALDYVLIAMNDARRTAQLEHTFQLARTTAFAEVSLVGKSLLTDFDVGPTGGVLRVVKQLDAAWEYDTQSVSGSSVYTRRNKIPLFRHSVFDQELSYSPNVGGGASTAIVSGQVRSPRNFLYVQGTSVFHSALTTPTFAMFDVVEFLQDHDGGSSEDIFLTYFVTWLKYATLMNLNQFLKDGERFAIDATFFNGLWESVKQFDASQGSGFDSLAFD